MLKLRSPLFQHVLPRMSTAFYSTNIIPEEKTVKNSHGIEFTTNFQNEGFEKFYKQQAVCSDEEFPDLMASCRTGEQCEISHDQMTIHISNERERIGRVITGPVFTAYGHF